MRESLKKDEKISKNKLTAVEPFFTASWAYSTWKRCPSGEKMVIALSYEPPDMSVWFLRFFLWAEEKEPRRNKSCEQRMTLHEA